VLNGAEEHGSGWNSRIGKIFPRIANFCYPILQVEQEKFVEMLLCLANRKYGMGKVGI
jgi:hypothetical protein